VKELAGQAASLLARTGLLGALEHFDRRSDRIRVLAYHRVDDPEAEPDLDPGLVSATPKDFGAQVELIARHYHAISLPDLMAAQRGERTLPERAVLLTFDDGYRDFAEQAWPVLRRAGVPAVLFVPTSFPDRPGPGFWWDRLHAALSRTDQEFVDPPGLARIPLGEARERRLAHRILRTHAKTLTHEQAMLWLDSLIDELAEVPSLHRVLGWHELRRLTAEGLSVCSHGHRHALCTRLSPSDLADDLATSRRLIETELRDPSQVAALAYPASANDADVRAAVSEAGYAIAFGGRRGIDSIPLGDANHVMRMPVHRYGTGLFRAQLRPSVTAMGRLWMEGRDRARSIRRMKRGEGSIRPLAGERLERVRRDEMMKDMK
jgi:peptidoglycan/xylan/chitin deacetylase (PgdA/CDA1 family)